MIKTNKGSPYSLPLCTYTCIKMEYDFWYAFVPEETLIRQLKPHFFYLAEDLDGGEYLFAFRMLMVLFRREFSFVDTLYLWEVRWNFCIQLNLSRNVLFLLKKSHCFTEP
jgi:hypothetical protein